MTSPATKLMMASGGAVAAPDPPTVTSLRDQWWANDLIGTYADSDPVGSWPSNNGSWELTASGSARPTYRASAINGQPAVDFDGSDDWIKNGVTDYANADQDGVVVAVIMPDAVPSGTNYWVFSGSSESVGTSYMTFGVRNVSSNLRPYIVWRNASGWDGIYGTTTAMSTGTAYVVEWSSSGTNWTLRVNNTSQSETGTLGTDTGRWFGDLGASPGTDNIGMGAWQSTSTTDYFNGKIAYLMVANDPLSAGDRTDLYDWINEVYGI